MTPEQKLDHDAYTACGYERVHNCGAEWWAYNHNLPFRLETWSSTDDAIGHAERGRFHVDPEHIFDPGGPYRWKAQVRKLLRMDGDVGVFTDWVEGDWDWMQGSAIRNAILAHTTKGAE